MDDFYSVLSDFWLITMVFLGFFLLLVILVELKGVEEFTSTPWGKHVFDSDVEWYKIHKQYFTWYDQLNRSSPKELVLFIVQNLISWLKTEHPQIENPDTSIFEVEKNVKPYLPIIKNPELHIFLQNPEAWLESYLGSFDEIIGMNDIEWQKIGIEMLIPAFQLLEQLIYDEVGLPFDQEAWDKILTMNKRKSDQRQQMLYKISFIVVLITITITIGIILLNYFY